MTKVIEGTIPYKLTVSEKGEWLIEYETTIENDMASLAIAQRVMEVCAVRLRHDKKELTGKQRKFITQRLNKAIDARFGLMIICGWMLGVYQDYKEFLAKQEEKRGDKADVPEELDKLPLTEKETFEDGQ